MVLSKEEKRRRENERKKWRRLHDPEFLKRERQQRKQWHLRHLEECHARDRKYNKDHLQEREAYQKVYKILNRDRWRKMALKYQLWYLKENPMARKRAKATSKMSYYYPSMWECEACGSIERLQFHHEDYDAPLGVITLRSRCHNAINNYSILI